MFLPTIFIYQNQFVYSFAIPHKIGWRVVFYVTPVIPLRRRLKQDRQFSASRNHLLRPCLRTQVMGEMILQEGHLLCQHEALNFNPQSPHSKLLVVPCLLFTQCRKGGRKQGPWDLLAADLAPGSLRDLVSRE